MGEKWKQFLNLFRKKSGDAALNSAKSDLDKLKELYKDPKYSFDFEKVNGKNGNDILAKYLKQLDSNKLLKNPDELHKGVDVVSNEYSKKILQVMLDWKMYFRLSDFTSSSFIVDFDAINAKVFALADDVAKGNAIGDDLKLKINEIYHDTKNLVFDNIPNTKTVGLNVNIENLYTENEKGLYKLNSKFLDDIIRVCTIKHNMYKVIFEDCRDGEAYVNWMDKAINEARKENKTCITYITQITSMIPTVMTKFEKLLKNVTSDNAAMEISTLSQLAITTIRSMNDVATNYAKHISDTSIAIKNASSKLLVIAQSQKE